MTPPQAGAQPPKGLFSVDISRKLSSGGQSFVWAWEGAAVDAGAASRLALAAALRKGLVQADADVVYATKAEGAHLVCEGWLHTFEGRDGEVLTRWVVDRIYRQLLIAQSQAPDGGWVTCSMAEQSNLQYSLISDWECEILMCFDEFSSVLAQAELPAWANPAELQEAKRYLVCDGWSHIFQERNVESLTRWVLDRLDGEVMVAQVQANFGRGSWMPLGKDGAEDLRESLINANDMLTAYDDFGVKESSSLPDWAS